MKNQLIDQALAEPKDIVPDDEEDSVPIFKELSEE